MRVHDDWLLTPERAAIHLPTATAVIADLHLGYDQIRCRGGEAVPAMGLGETLAALDSLFAAQEVRRLVIAGDLLEDARLRTPADELLKWFHRTGVEWAGIVPGNHDRALRRDFGELPLCPDGILLGDWRVVHGDGELPRGRLVHGHVHPGVRWDGHVVAPCYLIGPRRLILPAFSADAAGVNVLRERRWRPYRCGVIAGSKVLDFGGVEKLQRLKAVRW